MGLRSIPCRGGRRISVAGSRTRDLAERLISRVSRPARFQEPQGFAGARGFSRLSADHDLRFRGARGGPCASMTPPREPRAPAADRPLRPGLSRRRRRTAGCRAPARSRGEARGARPSVASAGPASTQGHSGCPRLPETLILPVAEAPPPQRRGPVAGTDRRG